MPTATPSGTPTLNSPASTAPTATSTSPHTPTRTHTPTPALTASPSPTPQSTRTPHLSADPTPIDLQTSDGLTLAASLYLPDGAGPFPGVLLSHMGGADKEAWGELPQLLRSEGFAVLAFDFRGHGESDGRLDPPHAANDVQTALSYLYTHPQVDAGRTALVGASMGGLASVIVAAREPNVNTVIAISTSPDAAGQNAGIVVDQLSPRPLLTIGCADDPLTRPERVRQLYDNAGPPKRAIILDCDAHANDILKTDAAPELLELLLFWLNHYVKMAP